jgi:hypothetical protein
MQSWSTGYLAVYLISSAQEGSCPVFCPINSLAFLSLIFRGHCDFARIPDSHIPLTIQAPRQLRSIMALGNPVREGLAPWEALARGPHF